MVRASSGRGNVQVQSIRTAAASNSLCSRDGPALFTIIVCSRYPSASRENVRIVVPTKPERAAAFGYGSSRQVTLDGSFGGVAESSAGIGTDCAMTCVDRMQRAAASASFIGRFLVGGVTPNV